MNPKNRKHHENHCRERHQSSAKNRKHHEQLCRGRYQSKAKSEASCASLPQSAPKQSKSEASSCIIAAAGTAAKAIGSTVSIIGCTCHENPKNRNHDEHRPSDPYAANRQKHHQGLQAATNHRWPGWLLGGKAAGSTIIKAKQRVGCLVSRFALELV